LNLQKKQLDSGIKLCKERAKQFALDAKLLAENDSLANALGLYTIALEEFGKGKLMEKKSKQNGEKYLIPTWIFGKFNNNKINSHSEKIKESFEYVPFDAKRITLWGINITEPFPEDTCIKVGSNSEPINIPEGLTGEFSLAIDPNLEARMKIFYVDWDEKKKRWFEQYKPEKKVFLLAISTFLEFLDNPKKYTIWRDEKGVQHQETNY